jgi:hypothetical protein
LKRNVSENCQPGAATFVGILGHETFGKRQKDTLKQNLVLILRFPGVKIHRPVDKHSLIFSLFLVLKTMFTS